VVKIEASENKIYLEDGQILEYDALAINIGSRTKDSGNIKGVWENSLTTRPINYLLDKVVAKENQLKTAGVVPVVAICGAGAAGTELSFAFKTRWSKFFG
jgi:NADH dehydrogenase FAD-containing subunit